MKVLIVDSDLQSSNTLTELIRNKSNFQILQATNGLEGLDFFEKNSPDIVFTAVKIPKLDGLDFLSSIRDRNSDTIVILITDEGLEEYALEALRRGANDYLKKPFSQNNLYPLLDKYEGIITTRVKLQETLNLIVHRSFKMVLENKMELVPIIVQRLLIETGDALPPEDRLGVRIGLVELIANAIEHGNLEITYEEKLAAMSESFEGIYKLYNNRLSNPKLAARRVTIEFSMNSQECVWTITDEGSGFDWQSLPSPLDPQNLGHPNGRGIFLARLHFDKVDFIGKGNQVRVVKKIRKNKTK